MRRAHEVDGTVDARLTSGGIDRLRGVAHVTRDVRATRELFEQLGFTVTAPAGTGPGARIGFAESFVELVGHLDADAEDPPLQGLTLHTDDVGWAAAGLAGAGVATSGPTLVEHGDGAVTTVTRVLELDAGDPERPGLLPEGRVVLVESAVGPPSQAPDPTHPNGAIGLRGVYLCVRDGRVGSTADRYARYLDRWPLAEGATAVLDLAGGSIVIVDAGALDAVLPGEAPSALPAFVAISVAVDHVDVARSVVEDGGQPTVDLPSGGFLVPSRAGLRAALVFR